jgi:acylphosphatase
MNLPSGEVLLEAQSNPGLLAELVAWLRIGPPMAEVSDIHFDEIALVEGETKFEVRYGG